MRRHVPPTNTKMRLSRYRAPGKAGDRRSSARFRVAVNGVGRKGRQANGDVLGPFGARRTVSHPLTGLSDNRLPGGNVVGAATRFDMQHPAKQDGVLGELGRLTRLTPS